MEIEEHALHQHVLLCSAPQDMEDLPPEEAEFSFFVVFISLPALRVTLELGFPEALSQGDNCAAFWGRARYLCGNARLFQSSGASNAGRLSEAGIKGL